MAPHIKANGFNANVKAMVFKSGQMAVNTVASGKTTWQMGMVHYITMTVTSTKANG